MVNFEDLFILMKSYGMMDFFFPWMFFTALIYGLLQSKKIISSEVSVNAALALSISFLIAYFGRGLFLANLFWIMSIYLTIALLAILFGALFGVDVLDKLKGATWLVYAGLALAAIAFVLTLSATGNLSYFGIDNLSLDGWENIIGVIVIAGAMVAVVALIAKG